MEINAKTSVEEIINSCPESLNVFKKYGLEVFVCGEPVWDDLGTVCRRKGADTEKVAKELKAVCR